ncbi:bacteriohemerythrin [Magnetovibrio sp. PR-2]|uniref:bacteriohemerythrin n=1 Tax=Magnetovibrio sp. PR-2 TaxID=3120356 RepID=UPI002FCDF2ED
MNNVPPKWSDDFSVGIESIDKDHMFLFGLVDTLAETLNGNGDDLHEVVDGLTGYVHGHFEREEYLMLETNYPHYKEHVRAHRNFMRLVYAVRRIMTDEPEILDTDKLLTFLEQWLVHHIQGDDLKLGVYLNQSYWNKLHSWDDDLQKWLTTRENDDEIHDLITIKSRVPLSRATVLRRCARILNDDGDEARDLVNLTDPTKLITKEDAYKLASVLVKAKMK